jgi:putative protein kinase ArgK-like GTPase of G3E family
VLGDRVRMRDLSGDPNVFIRSMATRGSLGGLAQATANMVQVFDAAGFDVIIIETVGAGQSEVDVARLAHTTWLWKRPASVMIFKPSKRAFLRLQIFSSSTRQTPGVENTEKALKSMLDLAHPAERFFNITAQPCGSCSQTRFIHHADVDSTHSTDGSTEGKGIVELAEQLRGMWRISAQSGDWALRERSPARGRVGGADPRGVD